MTEKNEDKYFTFNTINQLGLERNEKLDAIEEATTSGGGGDATAANQSTIIANQTNGTQKVVCMGSEDPNDPAGTQKQLHLDGNGNVQAEVVNTINIAPANTLNSGITNDPANSVAVGLRGRTTITDASTETFLKCDASGVLEVSSSGGGGGSGNANTYPTLASITTATNFAGGQVQSNYIELTNAKNIVINCIHTGDATARSDFSNDVAFSLEFTDDNTATVCYSGATSPVFAFGGIQADGTTTGSAVAALSCGENSEATSQITGKFCRVTCVNNNSSLTSTAYAVDFKVVISGI